MADTKDNHECQFTIPVEWATKTERVMGAVPISRVIKLRCACGKEIDR